MVLVKWDQNTGEILYVRQGDGPGEYTDDVNAEAVRELLCKAETINEEVIAGSIISTYNGELPEASCHAIVDTFKTNSNSSAEEESTKTAIGFVEAQNDKKLGLIICEECNFNPSAPGEWRFDTRETSGWHYHDWHCPNCGTIVYTELVDRPEDDSVAW